MIGTIIEPVTSERRLIEQARSGDRDAFMELVRTHDQAMRGLAFNILRDLTLMDDALQDAYLAAYRGIGRFRAESSFKTWLFSIVHNACIDLIRKRRPEIPIDQDPRTSVHVDDEAITRVDLARALERLPAIHRSTVLLVDLHGLDYEETARVTGVPVGTVRSRLNRARATLRSALEGGDR